MAIELAMTAPEELARLEATTRAFANANGSSWVESEPWEFICGFVSCRIKLTRLRGGHHRPKRIWLLNMRPIGHNALLGRIRDLEKNLFTPDTHKG